MAPALIDALVERGRGRAPIFSSSRAPWACSTASPVRHAAAARRPTSPRDFDCRCCSSSTCRGNRNRRRRWCAASSRTIRRCRSAASCSIASAASGIGGSWPTPSMRSAFPSSARSRATPILSLPERHLGLVQASEHGDLAERLAHLADMAETPSRSRRDPASRTRRLAFRPAAQRRRSPPPGQRIALAQDAAFSFVYPHVLDGWRRGRGRDRDLLAARRRGAAGALRQLLASRRLSRASRRTARRGRPLSRRPRALRRDAAGAWRVRRLHGARREPRRRRRASRTAWRGCSATPRASQSPSFISAIARRGFSTAARWGKPAHALRGHEFHYAALVAEGSDRPLLELADGEGRKLGAAGGRRGHVTGTFFHAVARQHD